jgi:hypothetical protein
MKVDVELACGVELVPFRRRLGVERCDPRLADVVPEEGRSPLMSARKRGCFSTLQPPALNPRSAITNFGGWNLPLPLLSAAHTRASPKPTLPARPSPVMSARNRGLRWTSQRADSGPTATDGMQHPPRAPGIPNWSGAGCSHTNCTQALPPSRKPTGHSTSFLSSELATDSIRPVTSANSVRTTCWTWLGSHQ